MARPRKLADATTGNFTKEQLLEKKEAESKIGNFNDLSETPPDFLDEVAKEEYVRVVEEIKKMPIVDLDKVLLIQYCSFYSDFLGASEDVSTNGSYFIDADGKKKVNPAFTIKERAATQMRSAAGLLGLTVDSRLRIVAPTKEENKDPFSKFASDA